MGVWVGDRSRPAHHKYKGLTGFPVSPLLFPDIFSAALNGRSFQTILKAAQPFSVGRWKSQPRLFSHTSRKCDFRLADKIKDVKIRL